MTKKLAVFGDPVSHSLSPVMHGGWIADAKLDATYVAHRIPNECDVAAAIRSSGFNGANVTVPHKEAAAQAADTLDAAARTLNAVNTLRWEENGKLSGFNTDALGLIGSLDEAAPGWHNKSEVALVLGAGGAGRAAAWGLAQAGMARVLIANRTFSRAEAAAAIIPHGHAQAWDKLDAAFAQADIIVNATTLGMKGGGPANWPMDKAAPHAIVLDAVYAPLETQLLAQARARGLTGIDGLGMLIHQGAAAFKLWFGVQPDTKIARVRLLQAIAERGG